MRKHIIKTPIKPWWSGDKRVEKYMKPVTDALNRRNITGDANTDIYNRAYEAVYKAIKDRDTKDANTQPRKI